MERRSRWQQDEGVSLILAMAISFIMLIVVSTVIRSSLAGFEGSVQDERWQSALAAADSGVEDYLYRLNQDGNYWRFSATNPPPESNPALTGGEAPLPGAPNPATFSYEPDTSDLASQGVIRLTATGTVDGQSREVDVTLRRRSFLDYLYFTDLETMDPVLYPPGDEEQEADWAQDHCTRYAWATPSRSSLCEDITFFEGSGFTDRINGPLHTNDTMRIEGEVEFNGDTSSSHRLPGDKDGTTACPPPRYVDTGGGDPQFANACDPAYGRLLQMPPNNQKLRRHADHTAGQTGCLFTGPTLIELSGDRMRVESPFTHDSGCIADGTWQALPANGVVYVQNVPASPDDANYTSGCPGGHPFAAELSNGPRTADDYGCRDGDVFLWGELDGQLTIAAENDVNLVWDTTVADLAGDDILGLVADNFVQVYHPQRRGYGYRWEWDDRGNREGRWVLRYGEIGVNVPPRFHDMGNNKVWRNVTIHAAILGIRHSFRVSAHRDGDSLGKLNVTGVIAQRYRGPVGTFNRSAGRSESGYEKNYVYDERLRYLSPPHFLDPVESAWEVKTWSEGVVGG